MKKILLRQLSHLVFSLSGFIAACALIYVGYGMNHALVLAAAFVSTLLALVLFFTDAILFARTMRSIFDIVEPAYESQVRQAQLAASMRMRTLQIEPSTAQEWELDVGFVEPKPTLAPALKLGAVEFREYTDQDESALERIEKIAAQLGTVGLRKKLLVSAVGSSLIDESSLGDYVEGRARFQHLAFPEIVPGCDLLAAEEIEKFRRPSTLREALLLASREYDQVVVIVHKEKLASYLDLFSDRAGTEVRAQAVRL